MRHSITYTHEDACPHCAGGLECRPPGKPREEQLAGCRQCGCIFADGEVVAFTQGEPYCEKGVEEISDDSPTPPSEPGPGLTRGEASDLLAAYWEEAGPNREETT
jgi:hypothetical protein